jgi:cytoplasmic tRNA 2-thiolation protein 1
MYAYFKRLDYFSTECVYAPFAARGAARDFVKDLEARPPARPGGLSVALLCAGQPHAQPPRPAVSGGSQRLMVPGPSRSCALCGSPRAPPREQA